MNKEKPSLFLIDAYALIYRSYFAFLSRPLRNSAGKNVSAVFGFMRSLLGLLNSNTPEKPLRMAAVFDSAVPTFRHERYSLYKATRQKAPDELHEQVPLVLSILKSLGIPILQADRYEADDIIATLAMRCRKEGRNCYIVSSDKDLLQLVGEGTYQLRPSKASQSSYDLIGVAEVKEQWSVSPDKVLDLLSLIGDSSDNVPGVKGIGEKTAVKLMARYGSLDAIYKNIAGIEGATGKKLAEGKESAYFSRSLIELAYDAPIDCSSLDALSVENLDRSAAASLLLKEGIRSSALELDPSIEKEKNAAHTVPAPEPQDESDMDPALKEKGTYHILQDLEAVRDYFNTASTNGIMALDFETDSLEAWKAKPVGLSCALKPGEAVYIPLASHAGSSSFVDNEAVKKLLHTLCSDPDMTIIAHNAKYDYSVSRAWGLEHWKCKIWDSMIAAWIVDPERNSFSLDNLVNSFFGLTTISYDSIVSKGNTFDTVPLEQAAEYAAEDADMAFRMKVLLEKRLKKAACLELFEKLEMPLVPILAEMEGAGIRIEADILREYGQELGQKLVEIEREIHALVGHEFNIASTKQLQEVLFEERKLRVIKKTKTGYSTDVSVLEELAKEDPVPEKILRFRSLSKLKSTYVDTLADQAWEDGRLRTHYIQSGTATGRLSSRDPNLQNIPIRDEEGRRIRQAFCADTGKSLISADYSQIELVVLAHLSGDPGLKEAFLEEKDVHRRTAALIFNVPEKEVRPDQRRIAKTINFGVMYGMSAFRLSNELSISRSEAQAFIDTYFRTYKGIRSFIEETVQKTEQLGYAETILGRRRYIPTINSRNKTEKAAAERIAVNTPIQGSAADIVKKAMIQLNSALMEQKSPAKLLLQVHDELILECPENIVEETARLVKEKMEQAIELSIPLRVSVEQGKRWGDFH